MSTSSMPPPAGLPALRPSMGNSSLLRVRSGSVKIDIRSTRISAASRSASSGMRAPFVVMSRMSLS